MKDKETTMKPLLLTIVAVLLGLNLVKGSATGSPDTGQGDPYIVKLLPVSQSTYHRVWSDGRVDLLQRSDGNCDYEITLSHGSVEHPFAVVDAVLGSNHDNQSAMLTLEDGRVDLIGNSERCTISGVGTPSFCTGDVDRSGTVGIEDFLIVLQQWGEPCQ